MSYRKQIETILAGLTPDQQDLHREYVSKYKLKTMGSYVIAVAISPDLSLEEKCSGKRFRETYQKLEEKGVPIPYSARETYPEDFIPLVALLLRGWDRWKTRFIPTPEFAPQMRHVKLIDNSMVQRLIKAHLNSVGTKIYWRDGNFYASGDLRDFGIPSCYTWEIDQCNTGEAIVAVEGMYPPQPEEVVQNYQDFLLGFDSEASDIIKYEQLNFLGGTSGYLIPKVRGQWDFSCAQRVKASEYIQSAIAA